MEGSGNPFLHFYAGIALILFLIAFIMIVIRACIQPSSEVDHCSNLPLEDDYQFDNSVHVNRNNL